VVIILLFTEEVLLTNSDSWKALGEAQRALLLASERILSLEGRSSAWRDARIASDRARDLLVSRQQTPSCIVDKIEKIEKEHDKQMTELADEYRKEVIIPFCKKYGLLYGTGMGTMSFFVRHPEIDTVDEIDCELNKIPDFVPQKAIPELKEIYKILRTDDMNPNQCFGYYVDDVTEEDLAQ
jgi:hypothetical protein